jgi:SRSO17 transposase
MESRFARLRVRPAHNDHRRREMRAEVWLLIEWPRGEPGPTRAWFLNVAEDADLRAMVDLVKLRWRIERDYEDLKGETGLDHYEGRGWRGVHHHGVLSIAAYAFLAAERARLSPPEPLAFLRAPAVPAGFRPRGSAREG